MLSTLVVSASLLAINQGSEGCSEPSKINGIRLVADEDQEVLLDIDNGLYEYCRVMSLPTGELEFEEVSCTANVRAMESMPDYDVEVDVVSSHELFLAIEGVEIDLTLSGDTFIDADAFAYFYSPSMRSVFIFTAAENSTTQIDLVTVAFNVDKSDPLYAVQYDIQNTGSIEDILNGELMRSFDESDLFMVQAGSFAECEGVSWLRYSFVAGLYDLLASRTSTQIAFVEIGSGYIGVDSRLSSARAYGFDSHTVRYFEADGARLELFRTEEFEFESAELSSYWALMWLLIAIAISLCCCFCVCAGWRWRTRKSSASKGAASEAEQETQTTTDIEMPSGQHNIDMSHAQEGKAARSTQHTATPNDIDPENDDLLAIDANANATDNGKENGVVEHLRELQLQKAREQKEAQQKERIQRKRRKDEREQRQREIAGEREQAQRDERERRAQEAEAEAEAAAAENTDDFVAMAVKDPLNQETNLDTVDDAQPISKPAETIDEVREADEQIEHAALTGYGDDSGVPRDDNDEEDGGAAVEREVSYSESYSTEEDMDFDIDDDGPNTSQIAGDAFETIALPLAPIPAMASLLETASLAVTDDMGDDGVIIGQDLDNEESDDDDSQNAYTTDYTTDESGEELKDGDDGDGKKKKRKRTRSGSRSHKRVSTRSTLVTGRVNEKEEKLRRWAGDQNIKGGHANSERLRSKSEVMRRKHAEVKAIDVARKDPSNVTVLERRVSVVKQ